MHELLFAFSGLIVGVFGYAFSSNASGQVQFQNGLTTGREIERSKHELMRWASGEPRVYVLQEQRRLPRNSQPRNSNGTWAKKA